MEKLRPIERRGCWGSRKLRADRAYARQLSCPSLRPLRLAPWLPSHPGGLAWIWALKGSCPRLGAAGWPIPCPFGLRQGAAGLAARPYSPSCRGSSLRASWVLCPDRGPGLDPQPWSGRGPAPHMHWPAPSPRLALGFISGPRIQTEFLEGQAVLAPVPQGLPPSCGPALLPWVSTQACRLRARLTYVLWGPWPS